MNIYKKANMFNSYILKYQKSSNRTYSISRDKWKRICGSIRYEMCSCSELSVFEYGDTIKRWTIRNTK